MDEAHPSSPGNFPSLNMNNLEEAHEDNTMANQASEAGINHNQYQVLAKAEGEEKEDVLMALDKVKDKAEDEVEDEAEDELKDEEEDEEEMEDIPMKLLPMPVCNHCLCYDLKIMVPPVDNLVAAVAEVLQHSISGILSLARSCWPIPKSSINMIFLPF
jgi:rubrerythrin